MSIAVQCLQCGATHQVNDRMAGRRVRCPDCQTVVHVPELDTEIAEATAADESGEVVEAEAISAPGVEIEPAEMTAATAVSVSEASAVPAATVDSTTSQVVSPSVLEEDADDEVPRRKGREADELDMTPMVDVTFLLLIFFMVTAAFSLQKSIQMPRQQTDAPSTSVEEEETEDLDMVEVQIDDLGSFLVMAPDWERETPGKQNLISALKEAIAGNNEGMRLVVKVHELAKLQYLVDAMDAGTIAGFAELEVMQVEEFD